MPTPALPRALLLALAASVAASGPLFAPRAGARFHAPRELARRLHDGLPMRFLVLASSFALFLGCGSE